MWEIYISLNFSLLNYSEIPSYCYKGIRKTQMNTTKKRTELGIFIAETGNKESTSTPEN